MTVSGFPHTLGSGVGEGRRNVGNVHEGAASSSTSALNNGCRDESKCDGETTRLTSAV